MHIIASNHRPYTFEGGGGIDSRVDSRPAVTATREPAREPWGPWEDLRREVNGDGTVSFALAGTPYYLTAEDGGGGRVSTNRTEKGLWERFTEIAIVVDASDGGLRGVLLLCADGRHVLDLDSARFVVDAREEFRYDSARVTLVDTALAPSSPSTALASAFCVPDALDREYFGSRRIWTPAGGCDPAYLSASLAGLVQRRYNAFEYLLSGFPYRSDYPELQVNVARSVADLAAIRAAGLLTLVAFDDRRADDLSYLQETAQATQHLVDWVFGIYEVRDVIAANVPGDTPDNVLAYLRQCRALYPNAKLAIHFGLGGESFGVGGAPFWNATRANDIRLDAYFAEADNGSWDRPDTDIIPRLADYTRRLMGGYHGYPILPGGVVLAEVSTTVTYRSQWSEAHAVLVNDHILAAPGVDVGGPGGLSVPPSGFLDGGTVR